MCWWILCKQRSSGELIANGPFKTKDEAKFERKLIKGQYSGGYIVGIPIYAETEEQALSKANSPVAGVLG